VRVARQQRRPLRVRLPDGPGVAAFELRDAGVAQRLVAEAGEGSRLCQSAAASGVAMAPSGCQSRSKIFR
jgi:hypothetical protein